MTNAVLIVWGCDRNQLTIGFVADGRYHDGRATFDHLDHDLLMILNQHKQFMNSLSGLAVSSAHLGGFASSRLLLQTINTIAWMKNVPIMELPEDIVPTAADLVPRVNGLFKDSSVFTVQVIPRYATPADITQSLKKHKFTIN